MQHDLYINKHSQNKLRDLQATTEPIPEGDDGQSSGDDLPPGNDDPADPQNPLNSENPQNPLNPGNNQNPGEKGQER